MKLINCLGYIGYEHIGIWDEIIIAKATMYSSHKLINKSINSIKNRVGKSLPDSGCHEKNNKIWNLLQIQFIDGSELNVIMSRVSVAIIEETNTRC